MCERRHVHTKPARCLCRATISFHLTPVCAKITTIPNQRQPVFLALRTPLKEVKEPAPPSPQNAKLVVASGCKCETCRLFSFATWGGGGGRDVTANRCILHITYCPFHAKWSLFSHTPDPCWRVRYLLRGTGGQSVSTFLTGWPNLTDTLRGAIGTSQSRAVADRRTCSTTENSEKQTKHNERTTRTPTDSDRDELLFSMFLVLF